MGILRKRILSTVAVPVDSKVPALKQTTVDRMIKQCFKVNAPSTSLVMSQAQPAILKESLRCMPLMWDYVAVPSLPRTALWPRQYPAPDNTKYEGKHPLCGRIAMAGLVRQFSRTTYPFDMKLLKGVVLPGVSEHQCLTITEAQCYNFRNCWVHFLEHAMGSIHEHCARHDD